MYDGLKFSDTFIMLPFSFLFFFLLYIFLQAGNRIN